MTSPAKPAKRVRTADKTRKTAARRSPGNRYSTEQRAAVVAQLAAEGMAATHKATGIPKQTLTRWAKAAGVDLGEEARRRTANAVAATRARAAEVKASTVDLLEAHIAQVGDYLSTIAGVNALAARLIAQADPDKLTRVATLAGTTVVVSDETADEVIRVAEALGGLPLAARDAEGILTRAVHDLQLLRGEATERGDLRVDFAVPRPQPADVVDQQQLGEPTP